MLNFAGSIFLNDFNLERISFSIPKFFSQSSEFLEFTICKIEFIKVIYNSID